MRVDQPGGPADPRLVEARCEAVVHDGDNLRRREYRCEFRASHDGLHYSWPDTQPGGEAPLRWGHQHRVDEEVGRRVDLAAYSGDGSDCENCQKPMAQHGPMANCR